MHMDKTGISGALGEFREGLLLGHRDDILSALDSLDLVELSVFIRDRFDVDVSLDDINPANFATLESIAAIVEARMFRRGG
jgi:Phosphopantetheine attachment site